MTVQWKCSAFINCSVKGKGKGHPITGHEGLDGKQRHRSALSLTSALVGRWVVKATHRLLYPRERGPLPIVRGAGWGPRAGLDGCGKSRPPTGIRSPDLPARSESLYQLSYPGPELLSNWHFFIFQLLPGRKNHTEYFYVLTHRKQFPKYQVRDKSPKPSSPRYDSWFYLFTL